MKQPDFIRAKYQSCLSQTCLTMMLASAFFSNALAQDKAMPMYDTYDLSIAIGHDGTIVGSSNLDGKTLTSWSFQGGRYGYGGMTDIPGTTQDDRMIVKGVSNDGNVIVGEKGEFPLYWTKDLGYQTITALKGAALGVSEDGRAVTGRVGTYGSYQAFRWGTDTGYQALAMPSGTVSSEGRGISSDGSVIAGIHRGVDLSSVQAFRWNNGVRADLGNPSTVGYSMGVNGISGDGNVIVGYGQTGTRGQFQLIREAFRWTDGSGFKYLPTLTGFEDAVAFATNYDGSVVVGVANDYDYSELVQHRAWRWTADDGTQTIEDWLGAHGVRPGEGFTAAAATGVSDDGSVVVGDLYDGNKFIARVCNEPYCTSVIDQGDDPSGGGSSGSGGGSTNGNGSHQKRPGTGIITMNELQRSVGAAIAGGGLAMTTATTTLNGAHSRPLANRVAPGQSTFWVAGDLGQDRHDSKDGGFGLAEVSFGHNFGPAQLNFTVGHSWARQDFDYGGYAKTNGTYLMTEGLFPITNNGLWGVLSLYGQFGDASIKRTYLNAGLPDASSGKPGVNAWGVRGRLQWDGLWEVSSLKISPYLDLTYSEANLDGYTETNGGFPVRFNSRRDTATDLRIGLDSVISLSDKVRLVTLFEGVHRFEGQGGDVVGEVIGVFPFAVSGEKYQKTWVRGAVGLEGELLAGTGSILFNATSTGSAPSAWIAAQWRKTF